MPVARVRDVVDRRLAVVLVACTALYAWFVWTASFTFRGERWFTLFDDAMISMTYARNLAGGDGLVWNPGQPAVEGYSNPLWTILMAVGLALGRDLEHWAVGWGLAFHGATRRFHTSSSIAAGTLQCGHSSLSRRCAMTPSTVARIR